MNLERELSSMRKREQELYKFILEKFIEFQTKCDNANIIKDKVSENTHQIQEFLNRIFIIEQDYLKSTDFKALLERALLERPLLERDLQPKTDEEDLQPKTDEGDLQLKTDEEDIQPKTDNEGGDLSKFSIITEDYEVKDETVIFTKSTNNITITIPTPTEEMLGREIKIINTENCNTKVTTSTGIKIGGQYEKNLKGRGQTLKIITDGFNYFVL